MVVATQNPMDLDYRVLSNAGLWFLGRLQTDADRERVIEGLQQAEAGSSAQADLDGVVQHLSPRWFVARDAESASAPLLIQPRNAISYLRGPMTRAEIRKAREWRTELGREPELAAAAE